LTEFYGGSQTFYPKATYGDIPVKAPTNPTHPIFA